MFHYVIATLIAAIFVADASAFGGVGFAFARQRSNIVVQRQFVVNRAFRAFNNGHAFGANRAFAFGSGHYAPAFVFGGYAAPAVFAVPQFYAAPVAAFDVGGCGSAGGGVAYQFGANAYQFGGAVRVGASFGYSTCR